MNPFLFLTVSLSVDTRSSIDLHSGFDITHHSFCPLPICILNVGCWLNVVYIQCVLTRESWDENQCPKSAPMYSISVLQQQYGRGVAKKMNLRYKSISKIAECLDFGDDAAKSRNILVVDDNLGFFDHSDRASGQIYEIPAWNGPKPTKPHCGNGGGGGGDHSNAITVCPLRKDTELTSLGAIIRSIVAEFGSIQKYLFNRVYSVFRHEYGSKWKQQMKSLVSIHCDDGASDCEHVQSGMATAILRISTALCGECHDNTD